jgi:hypothetical protein
MYDSPSLTITNSVIMTRMTIEYRPVPCTVHNNRTRSINIILYSVERGWSNWLVFLRDVRTNVYIEQLHIVSHYVP